MLLYLKICFLKCEILGDKSGTPRNHCSLPFTRNWPQIGLRWTDVKMNISFSIGIMRKITVKNQNLGMMPWPTFCNLETLRGVIFSWQTNIPLHPACCQKVLSVHVISAISAPCSLPKNIYLNMLGQINPTCLLSGKLLAASRQIANNFSNMSDASFSISPYCLFYFLSGLSLGNIGQKTDGNVKPCIRYKTSKYSKSY